MGLELRLGLRTGALNQLPLPIYAQLGPAAIGSATGGAESGIASGGTARGFAAASLPVSPAGFHPQGARQAVSQFICFGFSA